MTLAKRLSIMAAASLVLAAIVAFAFGGDSSRPSPAHGAKFVSGVTPQTKQHGISSYAEYSSDPKAQLPSPHAKRHVRKVTAHVAAAEQAAVFSVLTKTQTSAEAADPILQLVVKQRPDLDVGRAKALDPARTHWLLPTNDGQVCLGQKTTVVFGSSRWSAAMTRRLRRPVWRSALAMI